MAFAFAPPIPNRPKPAENIDEEPVVAVDEDETETFDADGTGDSSKS